MKIDRKCTTKVKLQCLSLLKYHTAYQVDQTCHPTKIDIPQQQCQPAVEERCQHSHKVIEVKDYKEECQEDVKHVCEEHIQVPIPVPVPSPSIGHRLVDNFDLPLMRRKRESIKQNLDVTAHINKEIFNRNDFNELQKEENRVKSLIASDRLKLMMDENFEKEVKQAMIKLFQEIPELGEVFANKEIEANTNTDMIDTVEATGQEGRRGKENFPVNNEHLAPATSDPPITVPIVTIVELPSRPGCRSFSKKTCQKIPIAAPRVVPFKECRSVPAVECFFVLKTVDDLECSPRSYEDCTNTVIDVPYIDQEEVCEDLEFDDCVDVEEQVPIHFCKKINPDIEPIKIGEIQGTKKRKGGRKTGVIRNSGKGDRQ